MIDEEATTKIVDIMIAGTIIEATTVDSLVLLERMRTDTGESGAICMCFGVHSVFVSC